MNETGNTSNSCAETVPMDRAKFKAWADKNCGAWGAEKQRDAFECWVRGDIASFIEKYKCER